MPFVSFPIIGLLLELLYFCRARQINFSHAPRGPMVNFRYYLGRLYMQQEQFEQVKPINLKS